MTNGQEFKMAGFQNSIKIIQFQHNAYSFHAKKITSADTFQSSSDEVQTCPVGTCGKS
jgi:hypothetical protein